ncbi:hypothetical protein [Methylobacterium sp. WL6]|uniref:hypothetical protein n=1 Tax=Methylobacterium sp. WL6 TaxID=2603901 RepID=UPI0011CCC0F7|nr:hypothetical protein [Methylobacterium sp. WL6]TXN72959.1 hypothetical protein FV230_02900 [Methylobacterium sp. WL6]
MTSPGRIEMDRLRERAERLEEFYQIHSDIEGQVDEACLMADLAMQWWDHLSEQNADVRAQTGTGLAMSERERRIAAFAFGEIWDRLRKIDERMSAEMPIKAGA